MWFNKNKKKTKVFVLKGATGAYGDRMEWIAEIYLKKHKIEPYDQKVLMSSLFIKE